MADGQQLGRLLLIKIGDGADPEVFTNLCGLKTRSFNMSANEVDTTIPSCTNPGGPVQKTSRPGIANRTFTGSGNFVSSAASDVFMNHVRASEAFNAQVIVPGDGTYQGSWMVTDFSFSGDVEPNMEFSATFVAADVLTFTPEA
ncbi:MULTISPECIES: phage tail tube protein [Rhizobium]|uniref:Phage tail protein n=1 Tax=Rhizobium tropici TaxID=398 RepID=A0A6P1CEV4_RHITR|nr:MULTISPECIES: phage tail tube protein [Rhizobium]AGB71031.1 putative phage major tail protein [Rhizobium tropici CIAT 899]MBB4242377.1 putative secreted protein [Rhizobium tropici]MBB5594020.1 putative secreted protein [Rhizobium tropici]MBB6492860.1 putative secreted protein [Rhizobium tropici]NEV13354.1 phage tail protein [Rhizobium tropici]